MQCRTSVQQKPEPVNLHCRMNVIPGGAREGQLIRRRVLIGAGDVKYEGARAANGKNRRGKPPVPRRHRASNSPITPNAVIAVFVSIPKMTTFMSIRRIKNLTTHHPLRRVVRDWLEEISPQCQPNESLTFYATLAAFQDSMRMNAGTRDRRPIIQAISSSCVANC
jgi:hypothetical protein